MTFDIEVLKKQTYLSSDEAAFYLRYTPEQGYVNPREAFMQFVRRTPTKRLPRCRIGRRLLFRRVDLDACVAPVVEKKPLRRAS